MAKPPFVGRGLNICSPLYSSVCLCLFASPEVVAFPHPVPRLGTSVHWSRLCPFFLFHREGLEHLLAPGPSCAGSGKTCPLGVRRQVSPQVWVGLGVPLKNPICHPAQEYPLLHQHLFLEEHLEVIYSVIVP